jgi:hypothetical protein
LRSLVDRRIERAYPRLTTAISPTEALVRLSPNMLARTTYPSGRWNGARLMPVGRKWSRVVKTSTVDEADPSKQRLQLEDAVPSKTWPDRMIVELDQPDQTIEGAWGPKGGYTNGIDVHTGKRWVVRRSTFVRIGTNLNSNYQHAVASILFWNGSEDTLVEDVAFLDCESGVVLGLTAKTGPSTPWNHRNGIVRRAWFYRSAGIAGDRAFGFESSVNARVEDVRAVLNGTYANAVEYRFAPTSGFVARHVQTDARGVTARADPGEAEIDDVQTLDDTTSLLNAVKAAITGHWPEGTR